MISGCLIKILLMAVVGYLLWVFTHPALAIVILVIWTIVNIQRFGQ